MDDSTASDQLTAEEARELVERARFHAEALLEVALRLYRGRAHVALGHSSWWTFACEELGCHSKSAAYDLLKAAAVRAESIATAAESGNPDWRRRLKQSALVALAGLDLGTRDRILTELEREHPHPQEVTVEAVKAARRRYRALLSSDYAGKSVRPSRGPKKVGASTKALGPPPPDGRLTRPAGGVVQLRLLVGDDLSLAQARWDSDVARHGLNEWMPRPVSVEAEALEEFVRCAEHYVGAAAALHRPELTGHALPDLMAELAGGRAEEVRRGLRAAGDALAAVVAGLDRAERT